MRTQPVPAVATTIWQVPAYLPYVQPALTDAAIAEAEARLGVSLPDALLDLLRVQNGGYIRYRLADSPHETIAGIGPRYPSLTAVDWSDDQPHVSFPLAGLIPFDGDGHWHLCLDYRARTGEPSVTYVDAECDTQQPVAGSFAGYLAMLRIDAGDLAVVEAERGAEQVAELLAEQLDVPFEGPDTWSDGVPTYRAALGTRADPQWVWIKANLVARGFVRPEDPDYDRLKHLMVGVTVRYPELPDASVLVDVTAGARSRVLDACARAGLVPRLLQSILDRT